MKAGFLCNTDFFRYTELMMILAQVTKTRCIQRRSWHVFGLEYDPGGSGRKLPFVSRGAARLRGRRVQLRRVESCGPSALPKGGHRELAAVARLRKRGVRGRLG